MPEKTTSCVQPARGVLAAHAPEAPAPEPQTRNGERRMTAQVGKPAPDFEASAYVDGAFRNVKLSDYRGHWVALCFYPGDFTFV